MKKFKVMLSVFMVFVIISISVAPAFAETDYDEPFINGDLGYKTECVYDATDSDYILEEGKKLPSSCDLSTSDSFPCVRSQGGGVGSCAAWATTYYQFGYQVAAMNGWNSKNDPTKQFSPKFTYNIVNRGRNEGSFKEDIYEVLKCAGAVRYSEFVPLTADLPIEYLEWCTNTDALKNALKYRIKSYEGFYFGSGETPITSYEDQDLRCMKERLNDGYVLAISTDFDVWDYVQLSAEDGSSHSGEDVCIKQFDPEHDDVNGNDGHAMCIVGYNDSIKYDLNGDGTIQDFETGAFKIVNSHGDDWMNDGFVWVMYDALNKISNCSEQNVDSRKAIFEGYRYYIIKVEEYPCNLIAEVEITAASRENLVCNLGYSSLSSDYLQIPYNTYINYNGGCYNFTGNGETIQNATFAFDYSGFVAHPSPWQKYYVGARSGSVSSVIEKIRIIDSSDIEVVVDSEPKIVGSTYTTFGYPLGMVGDVNNDGKITASDVTEIQRHCANIITFSDEAIKVADVNDDGNINTMDVSDIQRYLAGINDTFDKGLYAYLG